MTTKTFYDLADELHRALVDYYGGESGLTMARMTAGLDEMNRAAREYVAQGFHVVWENFAAMIREASE